MTRRADKEAALVPTGWGGGAWDFRGILKWQGGGLAAPFCRVIVFSRGANNFGVAPALKFLWQEPHLILSPAGDLRLDLLDQIRL